MAINTIVAPITATNVLKFPVLRQHSKTGRVYLFTAPMKAVLLAYGAEGQNSEVDLLGKEVALCAPWNSDKFRKCSITLSSKD